MQHVFTYGTLQDPAIQLRVFGRVPVMHDDVLDGFKKGTIMFGSKEYFIAIKNPVSQIVGKVLEATTNEMKLMDEYETDAYKRSKVTLRSGKQAWVYCQP